MYRERDRDRDRDRKRLRKNMTDRQIDRETERQRKRDILNGYTNPKRLVNGNEKEAGNNYL